MVFAEIDNIYRIEPIYKIKFRKITYFGDNLIIR